jgi:hypothetical protein
MKKIITIISVVLLITSAAQALPNWDIYSNAVIQDGDTYNYVSVYDTPPETTTLDMFGGSLVSLRTYDTSISNIYRGQIIGEIGVLDQSSVALYGGNFEIYFSTNDSATLSIYGGELVGYSPGFSEESSFTIYGYDFNYDGFELTGFLADGSSFNMIEFRDNDYEHTNLIEVQPPISATGKITPDTINLLSEGKWITCKILLPQDCNETGVIVDSIVLEGKVKPKDVSFDEKHQVVTARFIRSEVSSILEQGEVELTVWGYLTSGRYFSGTDVVKVISKGQTVGQSLQN